MSAPTRIPDPSRATVADMVEYWNTARQHGPLAASTIDTYLGACARVLTHQGIDATTPITDLDPESLCAQFAKAHPDLKPATVGAYATALRKAVGGYRAHHTRATGPSTTPFQPPPTPTPAPAPQQPPGRENGLLETPAARRPPDGTLGDLPAFLDLACEQGLLDRRTAGYYRQAACRVLAAQPHLSTHPADEFDTFDAAAFFAAAHPKLKTTTHASYAYRFHGALAAYTAFLADPDFRTPLAPPAREPRTAPAHQAVVALPRGREVSVRTPADLTGDEARAAAAVLRLHHPAMFTPDQDQDPATPAPHSGHARGWTLVFWPEHNPDQPESAHITGESFRAALADHARTNDPDRAYLADDEAIDAWFAADVFFVHVIDGHHQAVDAGTLL